MYPAQELIRLATRKAALQADIALCRAMCADAASRAARPLAFIDRMMAFWRRLSPVAQFAAAPLAILVQRSVFPRMKFLPQLLRWGPLVVGTVRMIGGVVRNRHRSSADSNGQFVHSD